MRKCWSGVILVALFLCIASAAAQFSVSGETDRLASSHFDGHRYRLSNHLLQAQACLREFDRCDRGMYSNCCPGLVCVIPPGPQQYQGYCLTPCPAGQRCQGAGPPPPTCSYCSNEFSRLDVTP